jgi:hypothetical protein
MAKQKDIHTIQDKHFTKPTKHWTDHYSTDDEELEKHLDYVSKQFIKKEREEAMKNKKDYLSVKFDKERDNMYNIYHQDEDD